MKLVIVQLLVAVTFLQKSSGSWLTLEHEENGGVNCTGVAGNVCSDNPKDCDSIFLCIPEMPNPIRAVCPTGRTCNAGNCSIIQSSICEYRNKRFKCNMEGMYPEPSSCTKYNYCLPPGNTNPVPGQCNEGWAYNPANTLCDIPLPNNTCTEDDFNREVPKCVSTGQNGALKSTPVLYYICLPYSDEDPTLYPSIFKCHGDKTYIGDYVCR